MELHLVELQVRLVGCLGNHAYIRGSWTWLRKHVVMNLDLVALLCSLLFPVQQHAKCPGRAYAHDEKEHPCGKEAKQRILVERLPYGEDGKAFRAHIKELGVHLDAVIPDGNVCWKLVFFKDDERGQHKHLFLLKENACVALYALQGV